MYKNTCTVYDGGLFKFKPMGRLPQLKFQFI